MTTFTDFKPHIFRAMADWIAENNLTTYVEVDTTRPHVQVPQASVKDGRIILNISTTATVNLSFDGAVSFSARFNGRDEHIYLPFDAILSIFPKEHPPMGAFFPPQEQVNSEEVKENNSSHEPTKPKLFVVK